MTTYVWGIYAAKFTQELFLTSSTRTHRVFNPTVQVNYITLLLVARQHFHDPHNYITLKADKSNLGNKRPPKSLNITPHKT